jgi:hypothetical protein
MSKQDWIPCSEKLPRYSTEVLATGFCYGRENGERFVAVAVCEKSGWWQFDHATDEYSANLFRPTHWKEIGDLPKAEAGSEGK